MIWFLIGALVSAVVFYFYYRSVVLSLNLSLNKIKKESDDLRVRAWVKEAEVSKLEEEFSKLGLRKRLEEPSIDRSYRYGAFGIRHPGSHP